MGKYIGGRIVPKHCGVWDEMVEYEVLSIVLEEGTGDSYISRRAVPAGTGLAQTDYWAMCSRFSEQMKLLEDGVAVSVKAMHKDVEDTKSAMSEELAEMENRVTEQVNAAEKSMQETEAAMNEAVEQMNTRLDANVAASTDADADYAAEVVDARVDELGNTHANLGAAIRGQTEKLKGLIEENTAQLYSDITLETDTNLFLKMSMSNISDTTEADGIYTIKQGGWLFPTISLKKFLSDRIMLLVKTSAVQNVSYCINGGSILKEHSLIDGMFAVRLDISEYEGNGTLQLRFDNRYTKGDMIVEKIYVGSGIPYIDKRITEMSESVLSDIDLRIAESEAKTLDCIDLQFNQLAINGVKIPQTFTVALEAWHTTGIENYAKIATVYEVEAGDQFIIPEGYKYNIVNVKDGKFDSFHSFGWSTTSPYTFSQAGSVGISFQVDSDTWTNADNEAIRRGFAYVPINGTPSIAAVKNIARETAEEVVNSADQSKNGLYGCTDYYNTILQDLYTDKQIVYSLHYSGNGTKSYVEGGSENYIAVSISCSGNPDIAVGDKIYLMLHTDDMDGKYCNYIKLRSYPASVGEVSYAQYMGNGDYFAVFTVTETTLTIAEYMQLLIDFRYLPSTNTLTLYDMSISRNGLYRESVKTDEKILYVSTTGSDANDGISSSFPLATIQRAVDLGAVEIIAEPGTYHEAVTIANRDSIKIMCSHSKGYNLSAGVIDKPMVTIDGACYLETAQYSEDILFTPWASSEKDAIYRVFVSKELSAQNTASTRSIGYNVTLWEYVDGISDFKLVPKMTLEECESTAGSWHYDGVNIYIHPSDTVSDATYGLIAGDVAYPLQITNCKNVELENLHLKNAYQTCCRIYKCNSVTVRRCFASHSGLGEGFSLDYSNGNLYGCEAWKNRNDGFNIHGFGDTHYFDCSGYYNYDDGISHHDGCTGSIHGGEWHHNGKGGISSPTYGAITNIYNALCYANRYGVYAVATSADSYPKRAIRLISCCLYDNTSVDIHAANVMISAFGSKYVTSTVSNNGEIVALD